MTLRTIHITSVTLVTTSHRNTTVVVRVKRKFLLVVIVFLASLGLTGTTRQPYEPGSWCCLCMCHSVDENKCARLCVKLQQGKKIVEEPQMKVCTNSCLRHGVKQIFPQEEYK